MLNKIATHGSRTTTGGQLIATLSRMHNHGRKVAIRGDVATCGNCAGTWPIAASGNLMCDKGRPVVIDHDPIACPCGKNRVIAAMGTMCYETRHANSPPRQPGEASNDTSIDPASETAASQALSPSETSTAGKTTASRRIYIYDSHNASPLRHRPYILEINGVRSHGITDEEGFAIIHTHNEQPFRLHVSFASSRGTLTGYEG